MVHSFDTRLVLFLVFFLAFSGRYIFSLSIYFPCHLLFVIQNKNNRKNRIYVHIYILNVWQSLHTCEYVYNTYVFSNIHTYMQAYQHK